MTITAREAAVAQELRRVGVGSYAMQVLTTVCTAVRKLSSMDEVAVALGGIYYGMLLVYQQEGNGDRAADLDRAATYIARVSSGDLPPGREPT